LAVLAVIPIATTWRLGVGDYLLTLYPPLQTIG
jgi:hypothetical protein